MAVRSGATDVRSENPSDNKPGSDNNDWLSVRIQGRTDKGGLMHMQ